MTSKNEFVLTFSDASNSLQPNVKEAIFETFKKVYPEIVSRFNQSSPRDVKLTVDPNLTQCPGFACRDCITISSSWFQTHPQDTDVLTHEVMHVVQAYNFGGCPSWLVEGIADYVRNKYGLYNESANWSMPKCFSPDQHYTQGYRVTAGFLTWLENSRKYPRIIEQLDSRLIK